MKSKLIQLASTVETMVQAGTSLKEISRWAYNSRETDAEFPYLGIANTDEQGVTELEARPTKSQKTLWVFFNEKAPGSVLPRYTFRVTMAGVEFNERLGKGRDNVRKLNV